MEMRDCPKISVLMPVRDVPEKFLRPAIESVLAQTLPDFELLILDDFSQTEECRHILNEYSQKDSRIRVIRNSSNLGITKTLNVGLEQARAPFIARLDGNDMADPERFKKQFEFMQIHPDCVLVGTWARIIDVENKIIGFQKSPIGYPDIKKIMISRNPFVHSSWFFHKDIVKKAGGYDDSMLKAQDYALALKLAARHEVDILPEVLCSYRFLEDGLSFRQNKVQEKFALLARKKALKEYGYPKTNYLKLVRPEIFYHCVPAPLKKLLIKSLWKI